MSLHVFANIVTPYGTAANNRAETEGNITTLQKIIWQGQPHTTVSAEAIRFALRRLLADAEPNGTNRSWDDAAGCHVWKDDKFRNWNSDSGETYIDDDLLGFMTAEAAAEEGEAGKANVRRAVLEVTRAISLTPWPGDFTFNAASPGATPSAQKKGTNPVPYGTEVHATRYQYGIAMTPERLRKRDRAAMAIRALVQLRCVAGNHARYLYDFAPESIVFRLTEDPAPRLLYCFETFDDGRTVDAPVLVQRVESGDISAEELVLAGRWVQTDTVTRLQQHGARVFNGVRQAAEWVADEITRRLDAKP
ncbi:MAG: type I-B CRISPR-associated protein Cas7/Cst2/DevR [Pirellulaceae bacterium]|nr:MAG: type I-B CRISPR-associated protein Cas7/Cst2/DevR [Pirellulaceae bacterium]